MKRRMTAVYLVAMALVIIPILHFTNSTAHAATLLQRQPNSPAGAQPNEAQIRQQVSDLMQRIQGMQQELQQAKIVMQQLQQQLQDLTQAKPTPPSGSSASATAQYDKALSDWQAKMDALKDKIAAQDMLIKSKEAELAKLQQQLANLQGGATPRRQ